MWAYLINNQLIKFLINYDHALNNKMAGSLPKILNVAEKNDAAKELAKVMSGGSFQRVININRSMYLYITA